MKPLAITDYTLTTALGTGLEANWRKLRAGDSGLRPCVFPGAEDLPTWVGAVEGLEGVALPRELLRFDCRNNRLAWLGLQQDGFMAAVASAVAQHGAERVAVFIGTSTSGIHSTERLYAALDDDAGPLPEWYCYEGTHNTYSVAEFVRLALGLSGPCYAVSTACSSSAKVFGSAHRALAAGFCDAVVVGGVDSLCLTTLYGFHSLQLLAPEPCRPCDSDRQGLSIGEAAGFALLERAVGDGPGMQLRGYGESSDAWHMSSPHPGGEGASAAMRAALARGNLSAEDVDYVSLHGTGTRSNDAVESLAISEVLPTAVPCASSKGHTGHTLGAAGIVEAVFSLQCIEHAFLPGTANTRQLDPAIAARVLLRGVGAERVSHVLSNSFGFGGSNCSLLLSGGGV